MTQWKGWGKGKYRGPLLDTQGTRGGWGGYPWCEYRDVLTMRVTGRVPLKLVLSRNLVLSDTLVFMKITWKESESSQNI